MSQVAETVSGNFKSDFSVLLFLSMLCLKKSSKLLSKCKLCAKLLSKCKLCVSVFLFISRGRRVAGIHRFGCKRDSCEFDSQSGKNIKYFYCFALLTRQSALISAI